MKKHWRIRLTIGEKEYKITKKFSCQNNNVKILFRLPCILIEAKKIKTIIRKSMPGLKKYMTKFDVLIKALMVVKNWPIYLADYFNILKGRVVYNLNSGLRYKLRAGTNDRNIFNEVMFHGLYNPPGFEIMSGDVVLDIGAHIGLFSINASRQASKVFAFEPMQENFGIFLENIELNSAKNVMAFNQAVLSAEGKKELFVDAKNQGGHSFYSGKHNDKKILVQTISLEDFFKQNSISKINFLKMDCEGSEYAILFNCPKEILGNIGKISMEYHHIDDNRNAEKLKNFLKNNGFKVSVLDNVNMLYASK